MTNILGKIVDGMRSFSLRNWLEMIFGIFPVLGQYVGSQTLTGVCIYEITAIWWVIWMYTGQMWAFIPCNAIGFTTSTYLFCKVIIAYCLL